MSHQEQDGTAVYLLIGSVEKRQLELCVGLNEASKCQELVELERGEGGQDIERKA